MKLVARDSQETVDPVREAAIIGASIAVFIFFLFIVIYLIWKRLRSSSHLQKSPWFKQREVLEGFIAVEPQTETESWEDRIGYLGFERGDHIKILRRDPVLLVGRNDSTGKEGVVVPSKLASLGYGYSRGLDSV